jgi:hypothetical protein
MPETVFRRLERRRIRGSETLAPLFDDSQARTGRGIHGLPKVSPWPAMPNPSTPYGQATQPFGGWPAPAGRAACGHLLPPWILLPVRA